MIKEYAEALLTLQQSFLLEITTITFSRAAPQAQPSPRIEIINR
jgi:hypothetical protein